MVHCFGRIDRSTAPRRLTAAESRVRDAPAAPGRVARTVATTLPRRGFPIRPSCGSLLSGGGSIAVAMGVMNVATYGFTMIAARMLGPQSYGALAGLMATLLVVTVLQLGPPGDRGAADRRRARARRADREDHPRRHLPRRARARRAAAGAGPAAQPAAAARQPRAPPRWSRSPSVPFTIMGGQAGILQGERRWAALVGRSTCSAACPRLVIGTALICVAPDRDSRAARHRPSAPAPRSSPAGGSCAAPREPGVQQRGRTASAR